VDRRKASYKVIAPAGQAVDLYVLGETKAVDAPWAFSAGEPELDSSWMDVCETLPEYEAGATYKFDFCRRRTVGAGDSVSFDAQVGGKVDIFVKFVVVGKKDLSNACADLTDVAEDSQSTPHIRTAPEGLRQSRCGSNHRGVSLPPKDGWKISEAGWDKHPNTKAWMRKLAENGSSSYLYVAEGTLWAEMPLRGLANVDMCLRAIAFLRDAEGFQRQCLLSWKEQVMAIRSWRQRLLLMAQAGAAEDRDPVESEQTSSNFPVRSAFIAPPALRSNRSHRSTTPSKRSVSFAQP